MDLRILLLPSSVEVQHTRSIRAIECDLNTQVLNITLPKHSQHSEILTLAGGWIMSLYRNICFDP